MVLHVCKATAAWPLCKEGRKKHIGLSQRAVIPAKRGVDGVLRRAPACLFATGRRLETGTAKGALQLMVMSCCALSPWRGLPPPTPQPPTHPRPPSARTCCACAQVPAESSGPCGKEKTDGNMGSQGGGGEGGRMGRGHVGKGCARACVGGGGAGQASSASGSTTACPARDQRGTLPYTGWPSQPAPFPLPCPALLFPLHAPRQLPGAPHVILYRSGTTVPRATHLQQHLVRLCRVRGGQHLEHVRLEDVRPHLGQPGGHIPCEQGGGAGAGLGEAKVRCGWVWRLCGAPVVRPPPHRLCRR